MTAEQNSFGGASLGEASLGRPASRDRRRAVLLAAMASFFGLSACQALDFGEQIASRLPWNAAAAVSRTMADDAVVIDGVRFVPSSDPDDQMVGEASWYGPGFDGRRTANGETFDDAGLTAAHPSWDMPSLVRVTNLENGRTLILRVNDRGPVYGGRVIDVSERGAELLGFKSAGTAEVRIERLEPEILLAALPPGLPGDLAGQAAALDDEIAELLMEDLIPAELPVILGHDPLAR